MRSSVGHGTHDPGRAQLRRARRLRPWKVTRQEQQHHPDSKEADMQDDHNPDPRAVNAERPVSSAEDCGASPAAMTWRPLVQPGMYVRGVAGDEIGQVKEVRAGDFLVDRSGALGLASDVPVYLPFERIHAMMADRITLDVPGTQVDEHATVPAALDL
jgi:hypothetical protein